MSQTLMAEKPLVSAADEHSEHLRSADPGDLLEPPDIDRRAAGGRLDPHVVHAVRGGVWRPLGLRFRPAWIYARPGSHGNTRSHQLYGAVHYARAERVSGRDA